MVEGGSPLPLYRDSLAYRPKVDPLSEEALINLKSYKYSSVDKSWISHYILRHYVCFSLHLTKHALRSQWNGCVELLPMWLAPNLVTLLGFGFIMINVLFLYIWIPDLVGPGPHWVYYSFAFGLWAYSTMDNIDGKQARRTGSSSPLGELFDHGIDSLNCTLASLCETAAVGLGPTKTGAFTAMVPCLPMFFSTWETYHTHTLYLGYFNGPTEGLIMACIIMAASGYFGPQIWSYRVADVLGFKEIFEEHCFRDLWVPMILLAFFVGHLPACCYNVIQTRRKQNLPVLPVFLEWAPMAVFSGCCALWLGSPHSHLLKDNHLMLFSLTMSFVFGRLTTKIILHHLTKQPFPYWTVMLAPLIGGAVLGSLPLLGLPAIDRTIELWYLRGYFVFALVAYTRWALVTINKICAFLDINCLTIKNRVVDETEAKSVQTANGSVRSPRKKH